MQQTHLIMPFNDMKKNQLDTGQLLVAWTPWNNDNKENKKTRFLLSLELAPSPITQPHLLKRSWLPTVPISPFLSLGLSFLYETGGIEARRALAKFN
jgi:hypothetical protein